VTPAGVAASAGAVRELHEQHDDRIAGQRLARERAEFEADRARRQFDACEPAHRLVARTSNARSRTPLATVEREREKLAALEQARPAPLTDSERDALVRLARSPAALEGRDDDRSCRKELVRALIREVIVTVNAAEPRRPSSASRSSPSAAGSQPGSCPASRPAPTAPWRIRLTDDVRARFVPDIPDGHLSLADAARALGCARRTVLHKVQRGELEAIHATRGRRKGLAINVPAPALDRLLTT
jgi:hypothetical protein